MQAELQKIADKWKPAPSDMLIQRTADTTVTDIVSPLPIIEVAHSILLRNPDGSRTRDPKHEPGKKPVYATTRHSFAFTCNKPEVAKAGLRMALQQAETRRQLQAKDMTRPIVLRQEQTVEIEGDIGRLIVIEAVIDCDQELISAALNEFRKDPELLRAALDLYLNS